MKARIKFRKFGVMKFIGHLDVMRFFQKAMRRAQIPIALSEGYSPHMIMSFAQPLGVGITSDGEYMDVELKAPIASDEAVERLNKAMVEGVEVVSFREISDDKKASGMTIVAVADYKVTLLASSRTSEVTEDIPDRWIEKTEEFMGLPEIVVMKKTKRSEKEVDIKPMIYKMEACEDGWHLFLATGSEQNLKPDLVMDAFLKYCGEEPQNVPLHFHRLEVYARQDGTPSGYVTLESLGKEISL